VFSPDGSRIYFYGIHEEGSDAIWSISANGGEATKVVAFDHPSLTGLRFTVVSGNVYFVLTESESDIWVMDLEWE
jgi:Tol biopolymer transport system component